MNSSDGTISLTWDSQTSGTDSGDVYEFFQQLYNGATNDTSGKAYAFFAVVSDADADTLIDKPDASAAATDLVYNGSGQTGISLGEGYVVEGGTATDAGAYTATVTPAEGYAWKDGAKEAIEISWSIARAPLTATYVSESVTQGYSEPVYKVEVDGFVGGEDAATAAGYIAPTVAAPVTLEAGKTYELTPSGGSADNYAFTYAAGTLTVNEPQTYTVDANLWLAASDASAAGFPLLATLAGADGAAYMTNAMNPMGAGGAQVGVPTSPVTGNATLVVAEDGTMTLTVPVTNPVFTLQRVGTNAELGDVSYTIVEGDFGGATSRVDSITVTLPAGKASGDWVLDGSQFRPAIGAVAALYGTMTVPLHLTVGGTEGLPAANGSGKTIDSGGAQGGDTGGNQSGQSTGGQTSGGNAGQNTAGGSTSGTGMRLTAGTYPVTANIWLSDRSATGLPLMPYLTSGAFPPMYPVTGNATLTVDESGHAWVRVPIQVQPRIMEVGSVSGLNVTNVEYGSNGVSAVTVDLGVVTDLSGTITSGCTVSITMGSLASTISGITGSHTWPATFQVVFTGVPVSGNSEADLPESARQAIASASNWTGAALTAGEGALAAAGTGSGASDEFLSAAIDGAQDVVAAASAGQLAMSPGRLTAQAQATASAAKALRELDPDAASGTSSTTALALAAALGGSGSDGSFSSALGAAEAQGAGALAQALLADGRNGEAA